MSELQISPMVKLLEDSGFVSGYVLVGDELVLWEHEENPPKPLTRPKA